ERIRPGLGEIGPGKRSVSERSKAIMFNGKRAPYPEPRSNGKPATRPGESGAYGAIREQLQQRLLAELIPAGTAGNTTEMRRALERIYTEVVADYDLAISRSDRAAVFEQVAAVILGYGPLEPLLADDSVTEIMVNGPNLVYIERNGIVEETDISFGAAENVMRVIERIVAPLGRRVDESSPMVDARLPDGSRVNVIIPPLSLR